MTAATVQDAQVGKAPSFADLLKTFLRIGLLSFGGPAGQIALMHKTLVDDKKWVDEATFLHALNFCMLLPGPEAMQLATYVGWKLHGVKGGVASGLLFVLPGLAVVLGLSVLYVSFLDTSWLAGVFFGLKAAVLAIVLEALIRIAKRALKDPFAWALAATAFAALFALAIPFPLVVIGAGILGFIRARGTATAGEPVVVKSLSTLLIWGALWIAPFVAILAVGSPTFLDIGVFFSKMAVVTFGGAYAVLSYVAEQAVEVYGWLSPGEMIDGLALAETTPGPLILVLSFVGFLAGFREGGVASGLAGGLLTAWVTFVPCFLWIFLGAPYLDRIRANPRLAGALAAITAAVVGVILNLTVWFGLHVLFGKVGEIDLGLIRFAAPEVASFSPQALGLSVLAAVMLLRLKAGVPLTLTLSAVLAVGWGQWGNGF
ncbi:chromate efflux transporter [Lacibacterium aquatile]|uniref:Chromate efflux transporter n=1 Tax=Lacibacterium aquatile TaxID=1168082 RepID=A0ABW5DXY6_9PROT